jgi:hypothetical protein
VAYATRGEEILIHAGIVEPAATIVEDGML